MRRSLFALSAVGLLSAAPLFAFQNPPASPTEARPARRQPAAQPAPPLSGPQVHVTEAPGAYMSFGGETGNMRMARYNLRQYGAILKEMTLTDEQRQQADAIFKEFFDQMRAFQKEHADELRRLRMAAGFDGAPMDARRDRAGADQAPDTRSADRPTDRRPGRTSDRATDRRPAPPADRPNPPTDGRPDAKRSPVTDAPMRADAPSTPEQRKATAEAKAQLEALRATAPPQEPYMKRLYALLTAAQQADFDQRLETMRQAQLEEQLKRRLIAAGIDPATMQGMDGMQFGPDGRPMIDESQLSPQVRQRLRQAREQRRRAIENRDRSNPAPPTPEDIQFEKPRQ